MKINETLISGSKGQKRDGHYLIDILKDLKYFLRAPVEKIGTKEYEEVTLYLCFNCIFY